MHARDEILPGGSKTLASLLCTAVLWSSVHAFAQAPVITKQPFSHIAISGSNVTLTVIATGTPLPTYQWRSNATALVGATLSSLTLSNVALNQTGNYDVVVTNASGSLTSQVARVTVIIPSKQWTGNGDGVSWNDRTNWSGNALPAASDDIFIGGTGTITNLPANLTIKNLLCQHAMSVTGWLTATGSVSITGNLYLAPQSSLEVNGPNARFVGEGSVTADAANLYANDGGILQLPGLTHYSGGAGYGPLYVEVHDANSVIELSSMKQMDGESGSGNDYVDVLAYDGGLVDLSGLTNVTNGRLDFYAIDANSVIDLLGLKSFTGPGYLRAESGGAILAGQLTNLIGLSLHAVSDGTLSLSNLLHYSGGSGFGSLYLEADDSVLDLSSLRQMEGGGGGAASFVELQAFDGGRLDLSRLTNLASGRLHFYASDSDSVIDLSALKTITGPGWMKADDEAKIDASKLISVTGVSVEVYSGGSMVLSNLTSFVSSPGFGYVQVHAEGVGSVLELPAVNELAGNDSDHLFQVLAINGGLVNLSGLREASSGLPDILAGLGGRIDLSDLGTAHGPGLFLASGGGTILAGQLTNLVGASVDLYPDSSIVFTNLKRYSSAEVGGNDSFLTARAGSVLNLSSVRLMEAESSWHTAVFVQTETSAQVNLSGVTNIPSGKIYFSANGSNSLIDLSALKSFNGPGWLIADPGASILAGQLTNLVGVTMYATGDGSILLSRLRHISGGLNMGPVEIQAYGDGCTLDLSSVTRMEGSPSEYLKVAAGDGGFVNLSGLSQIANGRLNFRAYGEDSLIDLTALICFNGPGELVQTNGGLILLHPGLVSTNVSLVLSPSILLQPQNLAVFASSNAAFSVQANGSAPLAYQWYFNQSTPLANATNPTFTISSAGYDRIGTYRVVVTNAFGAATSTVAALQVAQPLTLAVQGRGTVVKSPETSAYSIGQSVTLTATNARYYSFLRWSDGTNTASRIVTISASNNYYLAIFTNTVPLEELVFPQWDRTYGGTNNDYLYALVTTDDGGFALAGFSTSENNGNKSGTNFGNGDFWVVRCDADGRKLGEQSYGGSQYDVLASAVRTAHGGFLFSGRSVSGTDGNKSALSRGLEDFWVVRTDSNGSNLWDVTFGGGSNDVLYTAQQTSDGGFILGGSSESGFDSTKSGTNYGSADFWIVRLDAGGNELWDRTFGGSGYDLLLSLQETRNGGFVLAGRSDSGVEGNKGSTNWGFGDFWVLLLDAAGNKVWDRTFGGNNLESARSIRQTFDGGFIVGGSSASGATGNKSSTNSGGNDFWIVRLDWNGNLLWEKSFGGNGEDELQRVELMWDGGFVLGGWSDSGVSGNKTSPNHGSSDFWIVRLDSIGNKMWEWSFGGSDHDKLNDLMVTDDFGFLLGGESRSTNDGTKTSVAFGGDDYWAVKLITHEAPVGTPVILVNGLFSAESAHHFFTHAPVTVKLSTTFPSGFIYYTRNGDPADYFTGTLYTGEFQALPGETINAIAYDADPEILYNQVAVADRVSLIFIESFTLTNTTPGGGGIVFAPPGGTYPSNTVVALTATNAPGWQFLYWEGGDVAGTKLTNSVTMNGPKSAKAVFAAEVYVRTNGNGSTFRSPTTGAIPYGSRVWLTGIPQPSNFFSRWTVTSPTFTNQVLDAPMVVTVTNAYQTNTAQFGPLTGTNRALTLQVTGQGRITRSPTQSGPYTTNAPVMLTATNEPGWIFTGWSGDTNTVLNPLTVIMNTSKAITANFAPEANAPPTVALTGPTDGGTFVAPATILLAAGAGDNDGAVSRVEFFSGDTFIAAVTNQPYQFTWSNVPAGAYALRAQAVDNFGARATSAPPVVIAVGSPVPIVQITFPTNGSEFITPTNVTITASAFDPDGYVTEVRFFVSTNLLGAVTNPIQPFTYTFVWSNVPSGVHLFTAETTDNVGGKGRSPVVSINAHAAGPIRPTLRLGQASYEVDEGIGQLLVTVLKDGIGSSVVNFRTIEKQGDTAHYTADGLSDYAKTNGFLVFASNEFVKTISIPIGDDFFAEPDETFHFELSDPDSGSDLVAPYSALITIRANDAGADTDSVLTFRFPNPATLNNLGSIRITIAGAEGRGQWRFPWETAWRNSGSAAYGLEPGRNYPVEYRPLAEFIEPPLELVPVLSGTQTLLFRTNAPASTASGLLRVQLEPAAFSGLSWLIAGETNWHASGESLSLPVGRHVVEFKPVTGLLRPPSLLASVFERGESVISVTYLAAELPPANVELPRPLNSYYDIDAGFSVEPRRPWAFNGQLLTSAGYASGFAVLERVVITAAHVVFDDATLTLVPEVNWFPQRQAGEFEPLPVRARGWFIMPGYIEQRIQERTNGLEPGESSPASAALDVAVIFFDQPVVRGGYGGFLVSVGGSNWIANAVQAMLIGYPTDDPLGRISPGKMHWLEAVPVSFTMVPGGNGRLFDTAQFLSFPGGSGGPVLVPTRGSVLDKLTYFPAGIYLGNSGSRARVRVIDTNALALINLAATAAALGDNFTGGGPICPGCALPNPGFGIATLNFTVGPPAALLANGGWRIEGLAGQTNFSSSATGSVRLVVGANYRLDFRDAAGFVAPGFIALNLPASQTTTLNFNYTPDAPLQLRYDWLANKLELSGSAGKLFQVETSGVLAPSISWTPWTSVFLSNSPVRFSAPPTNFPRLFIRARLATP